jgi:hypothetical protein
MQQTFREIEDISCWLLITDLRGFTALSRQSARRLQEPRALNRAPFLRRCRFPRAIDKTCSRLRHRMFPQARRRRSDRSESAARGLHFLELGPELLYARPSRRLRGLALNFFLSLRANVEVADDEIFHKPAGELSREQKLPRPKRPEAGGNRPTARAFRSMPRLRAGRSLRERSRRKGAVVANATGSFPGTG